MNLGTMLAALGVLVGVIGVFVGVAYAKASGRPVYRQSGNRVVAASPSDHITVQHDGEDVPRVTRTRIAFWNAGSKTVRASDVVEGYPISFDFPEGKAKVLSVVMVRTSDEANKLEASKSFDETGVFISFNYLERRQGGLIEVLHTSDEWSMKASGKVQGVPRGVRELRLYSKIWGGQSSIVVPLFVAAYAAFIPLFLIISFILANDGEPALVIATCAIYILLAGWGVSTFFRRIREPRALSLTTPATPGDHTRTRLPALVRRIAR